MYIGMDVYEDTISYVDGGWSVVDGGWQTGARNYNPLQSLQSVQI